MTIAESRREVLAHLKNHERMQILFACLPQTLSAPSLDDWEEDWEEENLKAELVAEGLLRDDVAVYTTTPEGIKALIAYINHEQMDED